MMQHSQNYSHFRSSPTLSPVDVESTEVSRAYGDGKFEAVDLKGRPVDKTRTGRFRAAICIFALNLASWAVTGTLITNVVFYAVQDFHKDASTASSISTNFSGTSLLLAILGGFLADSILGYYYTILAGSIIEILGLGVLVLSVAYSGLQPPACSTVANSACPPVGGKYTAALFAALYTIALGAGLVKPNLAALGAEQFDGSDPVEQKQSIIFFLWLYFSLMLGGITGYTLSVWIFNFKSKTWGFGYLLLLFGVATLVFVAGTSRYRHKKPGGSFITRIAQVTIAAIRKRNLKLPNHKSQLFDELVAGGWLHRTHNLRFLDKASIVNEVQGKRSRWSLAGVSQVEEAKRIYRVLPVWVFTCLSSVAYAEVYTFAATQGATLDRRLTHHFVIPPQSLGAMVLICSASLVPIYELVVLPVCRKITGLPYGTTPLKRVGIASLAATLSMICAALVERKRLGYIHRLGYSQRTSFQLPMSMWWLVPQYFFASLTELFLFVPLFEFLFHEVSNGTRSTAVSFLYTSVSIGYFMNSALVNLTNRVTKHHSGGPWLKARLNDGGLQSFYWLLAVILSINFLLYLATSSRYQYNYKLFRTDNRDDHVDEDDVQQNRDIAARST